MGQLEISLHSTSRHAELAKHLACSGYAVGGYSGKSREILRDEESLRMTLEFQGISN
jgi:hypothetical protein